VQVLGARQSTLVWQGNAHLPYVTLQRCVPQGTSFWHSDARLPGTAICPGAPAGGIGTGGGGFVATGGVGLWLSVTGPNAAFRPSVGCGLVSGAG